MGVIAFQFHTVYTAKLALKIKATITRRFLDPSATAATNPPIVNTAALSSHDPLKIVSKSVVSLREPLLEDEVLEDDEV